MQRAVSRAYTSSLTSAHMLRAARLALRSGHGARPPWRHWEMACWQLWRRHCIVAPKSSGVVAVSSDAREACMALAGSSMAPATPRSPGKPIRPSKLAQLRFSARLPRPTAHSWRGSQQRRREHAPLTFGVDLLGSACLIQMDRRHAGVQDNAGLPTSSVSFPICKLSGKRAARRCLGLLYGGDPSGSDKQIQVDHMISQISSRPIRCFLGSPKTAAAWWSTTSLSTRHSAKRRPPPP